MFIGVGAEKGEEQIKETCFSGILCETGSVQGHHLKVLHPHTAMDLRGNMYCSISDLYPDRQVGCQSHLSGLPIHCRGPPCEHKSVVMQQGLVLDHSSGPAVCVCMSMGLCRLVLDNWNGPGQ